MVFVLDRHKKPLMPCSPKRARLLLARKRAVVHRVSPFVIRLKDRRVEESRLQPVALKIDPGSKTTGMALVRQEASSEGNIHHALHLAEVRHRGAAVHQAEAQAKAPLRDAAAVNAALNATRYALVRELEKLGLPSRTNIDECGFPRGYLMREKQVRGIKTGNRVEAVVPAGFAACGAHTGRIAVRANGQFRMGKVQGIPARFCRMLQRADGYDYAIA